MCVGGQAEAWRPCHGLSLSESRFSKLALRIAPSAVPANVGRHQRLGKTTSGVVGPRPDYSAAPSHLYVYTYPILGGSGSARDCLTRVRDLRRERDHRLVA